MKQLYHVCLTAHSEVLLRNIEDVRMITNLTALAAWRTGTEILTDSQMSTHKHEMLSSEDPRRFALREMLSITKSFNKRHGRKGPLFDNDPFILPLRGPRHVQMATNYSLRQGLHHGQSETAFDYPWSTCNSIFPTERGVAPVAAVYKGRGELLSCLPRNAEFPDEWEADENGILLRRSFEQLAMVENWYGTARNFLFSMIRRTSDEWLAEQNKDAEGGQPVSLDMLEKGYSAEDIKSMLAFENNRKFTDTPKHDMDVCELIDREMLGRFGASSVYALSDGQKKHLADELRYDVGIRSEKQISRCLAMDYKKR